MRLLGLPAGLPAGLCRERRARGRGGRSPVRVDGGHRRGTAAVGVKTGTAGRGEGGGGGCSCLGWACGWVRSMHHLAAARCFPDEGLALVRGCVRAHGVVGCGFRALLMLLRKRQLRGPTRRGYRLVQVEPLGPPNCEWRPRRGA